MRLVRLSFVCFFSKKLSKMGAKLSLSMRNVILRSVGALVVIKIKNTPHKVKIVYIIYHTGELHPCLLILSKIDGVLRKFLARDMIVSCFKSDISLPMSFKKDNLSFFAVSEISFF